MLRFLFPRLTDVPLSGRALFDFATEQARHPHWYVDGHVPDTIDGRFRMLATIVALVLVRLESAGQEGNAASVALTERFIEVMESEHREIGLGDPKLGRTVRKLVGSLSRCVDLWRSATAGETTWAEAARQSAYRQEVSPQALQHTAGALDTLRRKLAQASNLDLVKGTIA